jgi:hypothetical protein
MLSHCYVVLSSKRSKREENKNKHTAVQVNIGADNLNSAILSTDPVPGTPASLRLFWCLLSDLQTSGVSNLPGCS